MTTIREDDFIQSVAALGKPVNWLAEYILERAGVALLPGTSFGQNGEGYLRLCFANSLENIQAALEAMAECRHGRARMLGNAVLDADHAAFHERAWKIERLLRVHRIVDHVGDDVDVAHRLERGAHHAE